MEKIRKLLDAVRTDPRAKELLGNLAAPKKVSDVVDGYAAAAKALGIDITKEEIHAGLKAIEDEQRASTAKAEKEALSDASLDAVAGGENGACESTAQKGEWCWASDSCAVLINFYDGENDGIEDFEYCETHYTMNKYTKEQEVWCLEDYSSMGDGWIEIKE